MGEDGALEGTREEGRGEEWEGSGKGERWGKMMLYEGQDGRDGEGNGLEVGGGRRRMGEDDA